MSVTAETFGFAQQSIGSNNKLTTVITGSGRKLEMQITKSDTNQELLTGEYSVSVVPEGKTGCTKTINYGKVLVYANHTHSSGKHDRHSEV